MSPDKLRFELNRKFPDRHYPNNMGGKQQGKQQMIDTLKDAGAITTQTALNATKENKDK